VTYRAADFGEAERRENRHDAQRGEYEVELSVLFGCQEVSGQQDDEQPFESLFTMSPPSSAFTPFERRSESDIYAAPPAGLPNGPAFSPPPICGGAFAAAPCRIICDRSLFFRWDVVQSEPLAAHHPVYAGSRVKCPKALSPYRSPS